MNEISLDVSELRQRDIDNLDRLAVQRLLVRCRNAPLMVAVESFPKLKFLLLECETVTCLLLSDLPRLEMANLKGVHQLAAELKQPLEYLELRGIKPGPSSELILPRLREVTFKHGFVPQCRFQRPQMVRRLGFTAVREAVDASRYRACKQLRELRVLGAKGFISQGTDAWQSLRVLELIDVGNLSDIKFIAGLSNLEVVNLGGSTVIQSGDLTPLRGLPKLKKVLFANRRHYNMRMRNYELDVKHLEAC